MHDSQPALATDGISHFMFVWTHGINQRDSKGNAATDDVRALSLSRDELEMPTASPTASPTLLPTEATVSPTTAPTTAPSPAPGPGGVVTVPNFVTFDVACLNTAEVYAKLDTVCQVLRSPIFRKVRTLLLDVGIFLG